MSVKNMQQRDKATFPQQGGKERQQLIVIYKRYL